MNDRYFYEFSIFWNNYINEITKGQDIEFDNNIRPVIILDDNSHISLDIRHQSYLPTLYNALRTKPEELFPLEYEIQANLKGIPKTGRLQGFILGKDYIKKNLYQFSIFESIYRGYKIGDSSQVPNSKPRRLDYIFQPETGWKKRSKIPIHAGLSPEFAILNSR